MQIDWQAEYYRLDGHHNNMIQLTQILFVSFSIYLFAMEIFYD